MNEYAEEEGEDMKSTREMIISKSSGFRRKEEADTCESYRRYNEVFYDYIWSGMKLQDPSAYNTWPLLSSLAEVMPKRLEIGPGLHPRLPVFETHFVDLSQVVVHALEEAGGIVQVGNVTSLPYTSDKFELICAFDILEHVFDDVRALNEISRVLQNGGIFIFSVPLHTKLWTDFDDRVGHYRRYEVETLKQKLSQVNLDLLSSAAYGMMPRYRWIVDLAYWIWKHLPQSVIRFYDGYLYPRALRQQNELSFHPGLLDTSRVDAALFICQLKC
jgi:SAM-dependent methyltransferase